jgi:hypothetical protein
VWSAVQGEAAQWSSSAVSVTTVSGVRPRERRLVERLREDHRGRPSALRAQWEGQLLARRYAAEAPRDTGSSSCERCEARDACGPIVHSEPFGFEPLPCPA